MKTAARLCAVVLTAALIFAGAYAVGRLVGPADESPDHPHPTHADIGGHSQQHPQPVPTTPHAAPTASGPAAGTEDESDNAVV
ncbi:MAG TPA: hypothetical protein VHU91_07615 [Mycobacteriales bacterium]|jgi:hypothetical protein|nr:hypothetical protein [Mycobacteriales bacterium]